MKIKYTCGLLALLLLSALFAPLHAQAAPEALKWITVGKPGEAGKLVVTPSEVSEIAIGSDSVFYVADSENSKFYRSLDAGVTWEDITPYLPKDGAGLPVTVSKIAVSPDKPGILAVVTSGGTKVYLSTDGGIDWMDTGVPSLANAEIQAIAISNEYTQDNRACREIAIGTAKWGDSFTTGQVWVRRFGGLGTSWEDQKLTVDPSHIGGEVSALTYSPHYPDDPALLVIASTSSDDVSAGPPIDYRNKTWLCLLNRETLTWNNLTGYPAEIVPSGDVGVSYIHSSLALPSNYSSKEAESRQLFVSYDREPDANDDVYWLNDITVTRLNVLGGTNIDICSIAYYGTLNSGKLLAGDVDPIIDPITLLPTKNVQVRRTLWTLSPLTWAWQPATVPPTGPGNAKVGWSPNGEIAYCGTSQHPGVALDESAFSASTDDGDKWRQMGLIDTIIKLADVVPAPDSQSLFITTYNPDGPEGIWRSAGDPLGWHWERLLTIDTLSTSAGVVILRLSSNYNDDYTMYAAEVGGNRMAVSYNRGNSWQWCRGTPGIIIDMAVADEKTIYVALPDGYVRKSTNGAVVWRSAVWTGLPSINMLALVDKETILVGGKNRDVAYSTDGGESFTKIPEVIGSGSGDVQVIADANYQENHTIYAATNIANEGIWRWVIGTSTQWEQIDWSITTTGLGGGQRIGGLAIGPEGTLYALRMEPTTGTSGGMTRSLNPATPDPADIEFDLANDALPAGTTFDPTSLFPTLPYLKLSGNAEQNELWTVDSTNQIIYRYQDTLCKLGPTLETPEAGGIIPIDASGYITDLILKWEALAGATEYESAIYRDADAIQSVWSETSIDAGVFVVGGTGTAKLRSGITYYWRVRAIEPVKSPWSEMWSFNPALGAAQWDPFVDPERVVPIPGSYDVPIKPTFMWNPADWATGYEFVLSKNADFSTPMYSFTGANALKITAFVADKDLEYSTNYYWCVTAISADSRSNTAYGSFRTIDKVTVETPAPSQSTTTLPSESTATIPPYLVWVTIGIGVMLFVVLLVFIVRTAR